MSIIARYPLATLVPAAVFGAFGEIPAYLIEGRTWLDLVLTVAGLLRAYYLYFAHARGLI